MAHALVVPSSDPADIEKHDANVEMVAMQVAQAFEEAEGGKVVYVHTPELARKAGLPETPVSIFCPSGQAMRSAPSRSRARQLVTLRFPPTSGPRHATYVKATGYMLSITVLRLPHALFASRTPSGGFGKGKGSVLISQGQVVEAEEV